MAKPGAFIIAASLVALLAGSAERGDASPRPVAFLREPAQHRTYFEHQDHRMLPVGTRVFYDNDFGGGAMWVVRPNDHLPAAFRDRPPDIVVVGPDFSTC